MEENNKGYKNTFLDGWKACEGFNWEPFADVNCDTQCDAQYAYHHYAKKYPTLIRVEEERFLKEEEERIKRL